MPKHADLYVFDSLADWEPGYAVAELNSGRFLKSPEARLPVRTAGVSRKPVKTMGGVTLVPDITLEDITPRDTALFLLAGGDTWFDPLHAPVIAKVRELLSAGVVVAAICGATLRLAREGLLDDRPHTSNNLDALKATCPSYRGEAQFKTDPAVTAGNLITASGLAPLEFAHHILKKLDVMSPRALEAWLRLYQTRAPQAYFDLMQAVPPPAGS